MLLSVRERAQIVLTKQRYELWLGYSIESALKRAWIEFIFAVLVILNFKTDS